MPAVTSEADALNLAKQDEDFKKEGVNSAMDEAKKAVEGMKDDDPESIKNAINAVHEMKDKESELNEASGKVKENEDEQLSPTEQKQREQELAEAKDKAQKQYLECEATVMPRLIPGSHRMFGTRRRCYAGTVLKSYKIYFKPINLLALLTWPCPTMPL